MQNLLKAKLPTPRLDGRPGAHPIRKHHYYLEDDGNLTPSEAAKSKKSVKSKPTFILAYSRQDALKKLIAWLKDDRRLTFPPSRLSRRKKSKKERSTDRSSNKRMSSIKEESKTTFVPKSTVSHDHDPKSTVSHDPKSTVSHDPKSTVSHEEDVIARRSISPLCSPPKLFASDSWRLTLQGIFLEMIRIYWLLSRRRQLRDVTVGDDVVLVGENHPVRTLGFLLTSASSAIDVVLSSRTDPSPSDVYTALSYLNEDRTKRVDYHLILNDRGVKAMERFVEHFSRTTCGEPAMSEEVFDSLNVRLVVSSARRFSVEPYLRLKAISYLG